MLAVAPAWRAAQTETVRTAVGATLRALADQLFPPAASASRGDGRRARRGAAEPPVDPLLAPVPLNVPPPPLELPAPDWPVPCWLGVPFLPPLQPRCFIFSLLILR